MYYTVPLEKIIQSSKKEGYNRRDIVVNANPNPTTLSQKQYENVCAGMLCIINTIQCNVKYFI